MQVSLNIVLHLCTTIGNPFLELSCGTIGQETFGHSRVELARFHGGFRMPDKRLPSYPAFLLSQNKHQFSFSTIPVEDLFPSCFVAPRQEDPQQGFQCALSESRADDIAEYLAAGNGSIPSNVVLSAQEGAGFEYKPRSKTISFARIPPSAKP